MDGIEGALIAYALESGRLGECVNPFRVDLLKVGQRTRSSLIHGTCAVS
jgi:hypothetical protein